MSVYNTIVVGTDGSETSLCAVDRAVRAGAGKVETVAVDDDPADAVHTVASDKQAGLILVGNRGLNTLSGQILGSLPSDVARRSGVDVLIMHTT